MNKIVCNICGTSYPENASQCPICGFARSSESIDSTISENDSGYQYVKGGRFSKANVKKRNQAKQKAVKESVVDDNVSTNEPDKKGSAFMVVIVIILLLAIIAVVGYIALRFFLPNDYIFEGFDDIKLPFSGQQAENEPTDPVVDTQAPAVDPECTGIILDKTNIDFESIDSTYKLKVSVEPTNTTDTISFTSSNEEVATVNNAGLITTVGEGTSVITVSCGAISVECTVTCTIPVIEPQINLNRKEITFTAEGESWVVYDGTIPVADITWSSDNNEVATITEGKVVAVGNGDTTIYGSYGSQTVSCLIHCKFVDSEGNTGSISEAEGESKTYSLYNPTGLSEDVTIKVGSKFTLMLVDENKNEVTDAEWSVSKESVCSYSENTVKGLKTGTAKISATYNGKTYTCIVRVVN